MGFLLDGVFFDCSEVVVIANKLEKKKGNKKNRKGDKGNAEEVKIPSYGIYVDTGMMIRKSASSGRLSKRVPDTARCYCPSCLRATNQPPPLHRP